MVDGVKGLWKDRGESVRDARGKKGGGKRMEGGRKRGEKGEEGWKQGGGREERADSESWRVIKKVRAGCESREGGAQIHE